MNEVNTIFYITMMIYRDIEASRTRVFIQGIQTAPIHQTVYNGVSIKAIIKLLVAISNYHRITKRSSAYL